MHLKSYRSKRYVFQDPPILEKLGSSEQLSPVDYSLPCAQIYTNLTQYLLFEGSSLLPLALGAGAMRGRTIVGPGLLICSLDQLDPRL